MKVFILKDLGVSVISGDYCRARAENHEAGGFTSLLSWKKSGGKPPHSKYRYNQGHNTPEGMICPEKNGGFVSGWDAVG
jgi:hypothetical protein